MQQDTSSLFSAKKLCAFLLAFALSISLMPSLALAFDSAESGNTDATTMLEDDAVEALKVSVESFNDQAAVENNGAGVDIAALSAEDVDEQQSPANGKNAVLGTQSASDGLTNPTAANLAQKLTGSVYWGNGQEVYKAYRFNIPADGNYRLTYSNTRRVNASNRIEFTLYDSYYNRIKYMSVSCQTTEPNYYDFYATKGQVYLTIEASWSGDLMDYSCSLARSGWSIENGKRYYYTSNGTKAKGWQTIDGEKYYFLNSTGSAVAGLAKVGGNYYYFDKTTNAMQKGWKVINGKKYYFLNSNGAAVKGLAKIGGSYYYFNPSGYLLSGWKVIKGKKYYFTSKTGAAAKGLTKVGNSRYLFGSQGYMLAGWKQINGKKYYFYSSNGAAAKGFVKIGKYRYYFDPSTNAVTTGWKKISGKYYYFYSGGSMATNTWIGKYHVNANGVRDRVR